MIQEDARLIRQVLDGNADAYEHLVRANEKNVYNLALKMTGNEQDAMDLAQDAFLKAYTNLGKFNGTCKFSVWLYRLATNICIDFLRSRSRGTASSLTVENEDEEIEELDVPDARFEPQKELERLELQRAVREGLRLLSEDAREIVILRELEGLSYAEIGERLSLEAGTVKSRLFRARKALCNYLRESGNIPDGFSSDKKTSGGEKE